MKCHKNYIKLQHKKKEKQKPEWQAASAMIEERKKGKSLIWKWREW